MKKIAIPLLVVAASIFSCDEQGPDKCEECTPAFNHMCEKIEQNACNPDYMENAKNRIEEECSFLNTCVAYGVMAETCAEGQVICANCLFDGLDYQNTADLRLEFQINTPLPDSTTIVFHKEGSVPEKFDLNLGISTVIVDEGPNEGNRYLVAVYDTVNFDTVAHSSVVFSYCRPNKYTTTRRVTLTEVSNAFEFNFLNWE